jgi:hypothetical protein
MKRILLFFTLSSLFGTGSFAQQKVTGFGGELSMLSIKPNVRMWVSKSTGYEVFAGISSEIGNVKPDDPEAGFKFLHTIQYGRVDRTYFGILGKWKWVNVFDSNRTTSLPIVGFLVGKEWYNRRYHLRGFAVELGYQYGTKEYAVYDAKHFIIGKETFDEFPLILNLRYSFYKKRR